MAKAPCYDAKYERIDRVTRLQVEVMAPSEMSIHALRMYFTKRSKLADNLGNCPGIERESDTCSIYHVKNAHAVRSSMLNKSSKGRVRVTKSSFSLSATLSVTP